MNGPGCGWVLTHGEAMESDLLVSRKRALREFARHGMDAGDWREFVIGHGDLDRYLVRDLLTWLGW